MLAELQLNAGVPERVAASGGFNNFGAGGMVVSISSMRTVDQAPGEPTTLMPATRQ